MRMPPKPQVAIFSVLVTDRETPGWRNLQDIGLLTNRDPKEVFREWVEVNAERLLERCVCDELSKSRGLRRAWEELPKGGRLQ